MANSPRPGVIQLDHPNVYMAAKEAQKDDWLRRGINLTGDIAGEALQKRNQDIRYRRVAGLDEDRRTNGEIAADLGSGVWGGLKAVGSGLASVGEGAWGLLKSPFTDDAPMAPTTSEDYRTEVGGKRTSPLAETPTDIIDSPEQILNAPKITTEVDGLPSTQTAEPGVKVSFPMTVAGTVERSNLPDTVVPKPTPQAQTQTPTQGQASVPPGMLQSPDWSEMFRLDPERAKYDWSRYEFGERLSSAENARAKNVAAQKAENAAIDRPIRIEMETKAIDLFRDVQNGEVQKGSDEYYERRKEIATLNAQLISRYPSTSFDRLLNEGVTDKRLGMQEEGLDLSRGKEETRVTEFKAKAAESAAKNIIDGWGDILNKIETRASMLESYKQGVLEAIRKNSGATFAAALKQLIQSLDNSVVMAKEWGPFQSVSWLDRAKAFLEKQTNNTVFSSEEMRQSWVTAEAMADATLAMIDKGKKKAAEQVKNYPGLASLGVSPQDVLPYVDSRLDAYAPISDFSNEPEWPSALDMSSDVLKDVQGAVGGGADEQRGSAAPSVFLQTPGSPKPTPKPAPKTETETEMATIEDL